MGSKIPDLLSIATTVAVSLPLILSPGVSSAEGLPTLLGKLQYRSSCASCHGAEGKGDGPMASELKSAPANLQLISKDNSGVFPAAELYEVIDGRKTVRAHGSSDMPVWGDTYFTSLQGISGGGESGPREMDVEATINGKILAMVYYIESIQQK